ncbi:hypothetical protein ACEWY4_022219 [Coilia grayii]|uniref:Tudor domain-containing protein n=1 Tax=Coilia grayii TaxID=363190 RepID=A0ABD1J8N4_9TELE
MCSRTGLPSSGSDVTVLISRVNSNPLCNMVEFWGNFRKDRKHTYDLMRREVQCYGESARRRFQEGEGNPGDQCLVQICDTWYRARVVSHNSSNYSVFLFDEGKTLNVKTSLLAWGEEEHFLLPPEVELCVLANVLPLSPDNKWSPMALEFLRSLCGKTVNAYVQEVFVSQRAHVLDIGSVSRQMLEMGFAKKLPPERFREYIIESLQPGSASSSRPPVSQSTSDKSTEPRQLETPLNYLYPELQPEMVETVIVTEVTNPSRIFCQLKIFSQELMKLTEQITKHYEDRIATGPPPKTLGSPCAARGPDGKWYRGILQQVMMSSSVAEVLHVDYGKKHFTPIDSVRHLAAEFFRMPVVTYMCSLHGVLDKGVGWTASQIEYLKSLLLNKTLIAKFEYQSLSEGVHYVTLIGVGSKNLNKDFGTRAECLLESEKIGVDYRINKCASQRLCPPSCDEELETKSNMKDSLLVNTRHKAMVQYVKSPSEFWVQIQKYAGEFDQMMSDMELHYNSVSAEGFIQKPAVGLLCAALAADGIYYRASVQKVNGRQLLVFFVDYGNTEVVDIQNLRHLPSKYQVLPPLGLKCALTGIKPVCTGWSVHSLNFFSNAVVDKVLDLHVVSKVEDKYVVQLSDPAQKNEKDLSELLCSAGLAMRLDVVTRSGIKNSARPENLSQDRQVKGIASCKTTSEGNGLLIPKAPRSVFKEYLFTIGSSMEVVVSHIDSPSDFWCQIASNIGYLKLLMQDIQSHYADSEYQVFDEGTCVARHPENGMWYRALIVNRHQTPHVDVLFVDYGQTRRVALQELRPMKPSFLRLNGQAFRCSLYNLIQSPAQISHEWDSNATRLFQKFVDDAASMNITLKCTIYAVMYDMQKVVFNVVDLETPFQSVCGLLVQTGLALNAQPKKSAVPPFRLDTYYYSTHNIKMGSEEELLVTSTKSVNQFYCQLFRNAELMQELTDKVSLLCRQLQSIQCPKTFGTVCFAKYTDGEWYRGQIKSTNPSILVHFVDYGNTVEVDTSDLLPIPIEASEIMSVPVQAIECGLSDISADIPSEVNTWFNNYVVDHLLKAVIVAKESNGKLLVELYDGNTQVNGLLKQKFAVEQRKKTDAALEQETRISHNAVERDIARFQKAPVDDDWRKRPTQSSHHGDGDVRPKAKAQVYDVRQKQHSPTCIPVRGDAGRNSTKFESKAPVSSSQVPLNRGDGQNCGNPHSRAHGGAPGRGHLMPDSPNKENGKTQTWLEQETPFINRSASHSAEFKVGSSQLAKHDIPAGRAPQGLPKLSDLPPKTVTPKMEVEAFISHWNSPSSFFVQLVSDEDEIYSLVEKLNSGQDATPICAKDIQEGALVNAEFPDDQSWYRAVIKAQIDSDMFQVEFIDFGNGASVSSSKICRLAQPHLDHPRLSIHCFLRGSMTTESKKYSDVLKNEVDGVDGAVNCTFIQEKETGWEVTLVANGKTLEDCLHTAVSAVPSDTATDKKASSGQDDTFFKNGTLAMEEVVWYKKAALCKGQTLDVFASSINGPEDFWCQYSEVDKLQELSDLAQHAGNDPELKSLDIVSLHAGNACLALFADDKQWYRAEILSKESDSLSVLFIDYGNESHVNISNARAVPVNLRDIPPQAFLCQLDGFDLSQGSWKDDAADQFLEILDDKLLKVTVVQPTELENGRTSYTVRVEYEDQILNDLMKEYWCSSAVSCGSVETREPASPEPATSIQSSPLISELESVRAPVPKELGGEHLSQEVLDGPVPKLESQKNVQTFTETLEENSTIPVLPAVKNLSVHTEKEGPEKDSASSCNQEDSIVSFTEPAASHLVDDVVQKLISDAVEICSGQASDEDDSGRLSRSAAFILEQDLNESTQILCIEESCEESSNLQNVEGENGEKSSQACEDILQQAEETAANTGTRGNALNEESAAEIIESDLGKLRRASGRVEVGAECIIWSQATQTWCRANVLSISKETLLVVLLEQDSQMAVDPQNIFEVSQEEQPQVFLSCLYQYILKECSTFLVE